MSAKRRWLRSHVERLLEDEWNHCRVERDRDGDYPFRYGTAACWVQLLDLEEPTVRVLAHAAVGVKRSAALLTELNDIQNCAVTTTVSWCDQTVLVSQTLSPHALNRKSLHRAIKAVGSVADDIGALIAGMFDGSTPFPAETTIDEQAG